MKKFKFTIRGNKYDVEIKDMEENHALIEVNGTEYEVEIERSIQKTKTPQLIRKVISQEEEKIEKKERGTPHALRAPLPGVIQSIHVKPGDIVKSGDHLMVMEAMKMENNILSDKDGVIEKILVTPGDNVLQGDALLEMI